MAGATPQQLAALAPLAGLSQERLAELAQLTVVERAMRGSDPLKERLDAPQSVFLLQGELLLSFEGGGTLVVVGGSEETRHALNRQKQRLARSKAITDVDLLAVEDDVLDILATWDQVTAVGADGSPMPRAVRGETGSGPFSLHNLRSGIFAPLPVAHIDELLKCFERVKTARGDIVIREGDEGDYYYVIESGRFQVERLVGGAKVVLAVEDDVLDILATWDQVTAAGADGSAMPRAVRGETGSGPFSLHNLRSGIFAPLPVAHIDELLKCFERVKTARGDIVIREGDEGDYYYVIESGRFQVERLVGGAKVVLAELKSGDAFGEEALVSEAKRNATVISLGEGELLRLDRTHFNALLREPLLRRISFEEANEKVRRGALWLDVRYPSEYQYDKLPGAINVPLAEVRNMFAVLDRSKEYVAYCQSGRRSAAAAFLFAQRGFKIWLLEGGLRTVEKSA